MKYTTNFKYGQITAFLRDKKNFISEKKTRDKCSYKVLISELQENFGVKVPLSSLAKFCADECILSEQKVRRKDPNNFVLNVRGSTTENSLLVAQIINYLDKMVWFISKDEISIHFGELEKIEELVANYKNVAKTKSEVKNLENFLKIYEYKKTFILSILEKIIEYRSKAYSDQEESGSIPSSLNFDNFIYKSDQFRKKGGR